MTILHHAVEMWPLRSRVELARRGAWPAVTRGPPRGRGAARATQISPQLIKLKNISVSSSARAIGTSPGTGMLPSFRSISALGDAPMCVDPSVLAGVFSPCHEGPAAEASAEAAAPAAVTSTTAPLPEATAAAPVGAGAPAMAAKVRSGKAGGGAGGSAFVRQASVLNKRYTARRELQDRVGRPCLHSRSRSRARSFG